MDTEQKTILIADDDEDLAHALALRCRRLGLRVVTACDATDALHAIENREPHLACLDVNMPRGNGLAACQSLASDEHLASIPVIILTGRKDEQTIRRCHDLSAHYVPKSKDVWETIEPLICRLLDVSPAQDQTSREGLTCGPASTSHSEHH